MNKENKKSLQNIINRIKKLYVSKYMGIYNDTDWHHVHELAENINNLDGINEVILSAGKYENYFDFDGDKSPIRNYDMNISTAYGKLHGYIRCFAAGTVNDPFSKYDLLVYIYPINDEDINESFKEDFIDFGNKAYKFAKEQLKNAKTFAEVKQISIDAVKKGALAGSIALLIFGNFAYNKHKYKEIMSELYKIESEIEEIKPFWKLISSNVTATVYNADPKQCNADVIHTASMFKLDLKHPEEHKIIAMESTMMKKYRLKYGDLVKIEGTDRDGIYQIQDTMHKKYAGKEKIDILVANDVHNGKWDNIKIYVLINPEEWAQKLKSEMKPALNQAKVDLRQNKKVNEGLDLDDLDLDDLNNITIAKKDAKAIQSKVNRIEEEALENIISEMINKYFGYDQHRNYDIHSLEVQNHEELNFKEKTPRNIIHYYALYGDGSGIFVDMLSKTLFIMQYNTYNTSKWYNINTNTIKFLDESDYDKYGLKVYIFQGCYNTSTKYKKNVLKLYSTQITENLSLYRSKDINGEAYYLPKDPLAKIEDKFIINNVKDWEILNKCTADPSENQTELRRNMFRTTVDFNKFALKLINIGSAVKDEYGKIYKSETDLLNVDNSDIQNFKDESDKHLQDIEEQKNIEAYNAHEFLLKKLTPMGIIKFNNAKQNVSSRHFYLSALSKLRKKKSDPYAKLDRSVLKMILQDNGYDIEEMIYDYIDKSFNTLLKNIKKYVNEYTRGPLIRDEIQMIFNDIDYNFFRFIFANEKLIKEKFGYTDEDFELALKLDRRFENYRNHEFDTSYYENILLGRVFYKMAESLINDNPNGYNNKDANNLRIDIIIDPNYNEGAQYSYYSYSAPTPFDFKNLSLAIDDETTLRYSFYMIAYAVTNAFKTPLFFEYYNNKNLGDHEAFMTFKKQHTIPNLDNFNFDSYIKCLDSCFTTINKNTK